MALRGSGFSLNVNITNAKDLNLGPCSCIMIRRKQNLLSGSYLNQDNMLLASRFRRIIYPGQVHLNLRNGELPPCLLQSLKPCQVKSEDNNETVDPESIMLDENVLKQDLQIAIEEENYTGAAKIRDTLKALQDNSKASVLSANARFYESFRNGDLATMQNLWAKAENVCCVHPGAKGITGYDLVMESWEVVWMNYDFPLEIELKDVEVHVRGDVGYATCMEFVKTKGSSWGAQFATNVFERIHGKWFICIHHASPVDL